MKLERKQMLEVEGGTDTECLRILRHEAGHALDTAFRLHFRRQWRELFGSFAQRYPDFYKPKPKSRNYVLHLRAWYAQAHPAEDFAETFAVWLQPRSRCESITGASANVTILTGPLFTIAICGEFSRTIPNIAPSQPPPALSAAS